MMLVAGLPTGLAVGQPEAPPIDLLEDEADAAPEGLPDPVDEPPIPILDPTLETVPSNTAAMAYPADRVRV
ncbi:MAG: hypothetical protein AAFO89_14025, partial [Planctomycetota bacterium]